MTQQKPWDALVGENLKARRTALGFTGEDVARQARRYGLDWTRSTLGAIEMGRRSLDLREAIALAPVLGFELAGLVAGAEWVIFGDNLQVRAGAVAAALSGRADEIDPTTDFRTPALDREHMKAMDRMIRANPGYYQDWWAEATDEDILRAESDARGEPERKAARALDLDPAIVALLALRLWDRRSLTEERDRRLAEDPDAPPSRVQARRGHITRVLLRELRELIAWIDAGEPTGEPPEWLLVPTRGGPVFVQTDEKSQPTGEVKYFDEAALRALDEDFGPDDNIKETD